MKRIVATTFAIVLSSASSAVLSAGNPTLGQQKAAVCGACHGVDGNNAPEIYTALKAPKLAGQSPEYIAKSLHDFKAGRRTNQSMSPQAQAVAEADIADLAAYFAKQQAKPNAVQSKDLLAQGEKIYQKGKGRPDVVTACVGCHGANGIGSQDWAKVYSKVPVVLAPAIGGQHAGYVSTQLKAYKTGARGTDPGSVMRSIAGRMDEKDIAAVSEYIASLAR
ncbi:MAG: c-type cytochrome [Sulfuritalea sp.]|jgi:cytochrome c553|nr:c-type cytochrome [Sulfuritalea sp.]MDP1982469.1 c-type cytochrome [Sulfuritalea sp.]